MSSKPGEIVLHLIPLPDDIPVPIRLRQLLKTALRRDYFRCIRIDGDGLDEPKAADATATTPDAPQSEPCDS